MGNAFQSNNGANASIQAKKKLSLEISNNNICEMNVVRIMKRLRTIYNDVCISHSLSQLPVRFVNSTASTTKSIILSWINFQMI